MPTQQQTEEILSECYTQIDKGGTKYPGMTYEEGVEAAIRWFTGETEDSPMEDE